MRLTSNPLKAILGEASVSLIDHIAMVAVEHDVRLYLVGGIVRDVLLERATDDIDFVIAPTESDTANVGDFSTRAGQFAAILANRFGGQATRFPAFGTARWQPDPALVIRLGLPPGVIPGHIDFAAARAERYPHPAALPIVQPGSLQDDLRRRDFSINALMLSPATGDVIDMLGGLDDLERGILRVLHPASFIDDPTRILRGVRFETRLGFVYEPESRAWMEAAIPLLAQVTGERLRNEIALLLADAAPAPALYMLAERGCLRVIHPHFVLSANLNALLHGVQAHPQAEERESVGWHVLACSLDPSAVESWCRRLLLPGKLADSILALRPVFADRARLADPTLPNSTLARWLDGLTDPALVAFAILMTGQPGHTRLADYRMRLRGQRDHFPLTDGNDLQRRGLVAGPCYGRLLGRLLDAHRDGLASTRDDENRLIERWLAEGLCDNAG